MAQIFDREMRREKQLYTNKIQAAKAKPKADPNKDNKDKITQKLEQELAEIEEDFFNKVADGNAQEMENIKARKAEAPAQDGGAV